jgi:hypothetical protein
MKTKIMAISIGAALLAALLTTPVLSADNTFTAELFGDNEVPPNNTNGNADFKMTVGSSITFTLTFSGLSAPLAVAHLHFAPTNVAGGVMIFLCGGGGQPPCPSATAGVISGTITAANVTKSAAQADLGAASSSNSRRTPSEPEISAVPNSWAICSEILLVAHDSLGWERSAH